VTVTEDGQTYVILNEDDVAALAPMEAVA